MGHRQICERAVFDYGFDDPRVLTYYFQQRLRAELLSKAARELAPRTQFTPVMPTLASLASAFRSFVMPELPQPALATITLMRPRSTRATELAA